MDTYLHMSDTQVLARRMYRHKCSEILSQWHAPAAAGESRVILQNKYNWQTVSPTSASDSIHFIDQHVHAKIDCVTSSTESVPICINICMEGSLSFEKEACEVFLLPQMQLYRFYQITQILQYGDTLHIAHSQRQISKISQYHDKV